MKNRVNDKILDRLGEKVAERNLPPRSDLCVIDVNPIDPLKCNVLFGYDTLQGTPTLSQLERYVEAEFHGKAHAQTATAAHHEKDEAISCCLTLHTDSRPITDAIGMRRIMANAYMDDDTGSVWQVLDNGQNKYLIRRTDENISDIVQARMKRNSRKHASFERVRQAAPMLGAGDTVRFYDGTMPCVGKISSINGDQVSISCNGKSYSVPRESVFNVVERSESHVSGEKNLLEDYWTRAVGNADFGRKLTRKLNQQETETTDTGWTGTTGLGSQK